MSDIKRSIEAFYAAGGPVADEATLAELIHPDYVSHTSPPGMEPGLGQATGLREFLTSTFDDVHYELIRAVVEGDIAAMHTRISATHTGGGLGFAPTGKSFSVEQMHFVRYADGRMIEHWGVREDAEMMRQLGVIPAGAAA